MGLIILFAVFQYCGRGYFVAGQNSTSELLPLRIEPDFSPLNKLLPRPRRDSMETLTAKFSGQHGYYLVGEEMGSEVGLAGTLLDSEPKENHTIYKQNYPGGNISELIQRHLFFIWYQGESDANAAAASDYLFNLGLLMEKATPFCSSMPPTKINS